MTIIYQTRLQDAYDIKDAFRNYDRDVYPIEVYQYIYDCMQGGYGDDEAVHLDVVAWCCDLTYLDLDEVNQYHGEAETIDEAAELLQDETTVICTDDEGVWCLAF